MRFRRYLGFGKLAGSARSSVELFHSFASTAWRRPLDSMVGRGDLAIEAPPCVRNCTHKHSHRRTCTQTDAQNCKDNLHPDGLAIAAAALVDPNGSRANIVPDISGNLLERNHQNLRLVTSKTGGYTDDSGAAF